MQRAFTNPPRRVVVKVGSAVLAKEGVLDPAAVVALANDLGARLPPAGAPVVCDRGIVLVSSGAVASGFRALGLARPPALIADKQAAAAVGQPRLMAEYADAFAALAPPRTVAQVLLTAEDIDHRARFLNARHTLERLLDGGIIPIVNENDSVSFAEIKLGDNDHLSSLVASLVSADLLIILSSVRGVCDLRSSTGRGARLATAPVVPVIRSIQEARAYIAPETSPYGTGGMATKLEAACRAAALGIAAIIADGAEPAIIGRLLAGEEIGTYFPPAPAAAARAARKRWIGFSARPKGILGVDAGARKALLERGASLLPSGLVSVQGEFAVGALVELQGPDGQPFARGLVSYDSDDLTRIRGRKAREIESALGPGGRYTEEAIHRDDLVLLQNAPNGRP